MVSRSDRSVKGESSFLGSGVLFPYVQLYDAGAGVKDMEKTFGIFTSPVEEMGITPKPAALALFKYFNGEDADTSGLYKYKKEQA